MKILFKFPSRSRPERFFKTLDNLHAMIVDKDNFHIACTLDLDDHVMNNLEVRARIDTYSNTTAMWGGSKSKIDAFNRDILEIDGWDICVAVSDDMIFTVAGFDNLIREGFRSNAPDLDAVLHYPDQDARHIIPVLYIAGRRYFNRDLYIYNPIYESLFCDNESMEVAVKRNKYFFMGLRILNHLNPAYGHLPRDAQFDRQQNMWGRDERIFNIRKANNFGLIV
jgi:hypothetical protein